MPDSLLSILLPKVSSINVELWSVIRVGGLILGKYDNDNDNDNENNFIKHKDSL